MGSTLRIIFATCFALFLLSGCSLFDDVVENCEEPQEYQESVSVRPLIVPNYLKNIQNKSIFNIPNSQVSNAFSEESFIMPMAYDKTPSITEQNNQMGNIEGDELSELLQLIDQTISNRQAEGQFESIYENVASDYELNPSLKPCLDGPPKYFSEKISPRSMPSQIFTQPSDEVRAEEEEKSRRQKRREKRQQIGKQPQGNAKEGASSKDSEKKAEPEGDRLESIFKVLTETAIGIYTGGVAKSISIRRGTSITSEEPIKPGESEITDTPIEIDSEGESALAEKIRNLAASNPELNEEQRVFIQNMSDQQILAMSTDVTKDLENQATDEGAASEGKKIDKKVSTTEEDDWFTRVKDQWAEGKAKREARRETRQERMTDGEASKEEGK